MGPEEALAGGMEPSFSRKELPPPLPWDHRDSGAFTPRLLCGDTQPSDLVWFSRLKCSGARPRDRAPGRTGHARYWTADAQPKEREESRTKQPPLQAHLSCTPDHTSLGSPAGNRGLSLCTVYK